MHSVLDQACEAQHTLALVVGGKRELHELKSTPAQVAVVPVEELSGHAIPQKAEESAKAPVNCQFTGASLTDMGTEDSSSMHGDASPQGRLPEAASMAICNNN